MGITIMYTLTTGCHSTAAMDYMMQTGEAVLVDKTTTGVAAMGALICQKLRRLFCMVGRMLVLLSGFTTRELVL